MVCSTRPCRLPPTRSSSTTASADFAIAWFNLSSSTRPPHASVFASLQSDYAIRILRLHALNPHELDTVYVIETPGAQPKSRSDGVTSVLRTLGGFWTAVATTLRILPRPLRDWGYNIVARHRYRVFGKYEACPIPEKKYMGRFLDN